MRTLRAGSRGPDVRQWQTFLQEKGFYAGALDAAFEAQTAAATEAFQAAEGLKVDGIAGSKTFGRAMQLGLDLAPEDPPLPGGPVDGVSSLNDAWDPPAPPLGAELVVKSDPRVVTNHHIGALPCPRNPPPPSGWTYWRGTFPAALGELAVKVQSTSAIYPMGSFVQALIGGQLVAARVEWHDYQGATGKRGCFRGTSLFRQRVGV